MAKSVIGEGKTTTEAINNGLKMLGCKQEDVEVKVLENEDKKVFFSILDSRVVKVQLTLKEKETKKTEESHNNIPKKAPTTEDINVFENNIKNFLDKFVSLYGDIKYSFKIIDDSIFVKIEGKDASKLIGYRGETVNSLQNLISAIGNKNTKIKVRVSVDIDGFREKREKTLKELASKLEKTVKRTGKKVILEPMSAYERKIIHTELQNSKYVTTYSIGEEPRRKVVIEKK